MKFKEKITEQIRNDATKDFETMVPIKYLINFRGKLEMPSIISEIGLILTWSKIIFVTGTAANRKSTFTITDIKLYIPIKTLSIQDNVKLLKQLELSFRRIFNLNKYKSKIKRQAQN